MSDSPVPDGPPRTDADDRPATADADPVVPEPEEPSDEPAIHLDIERPDRAEDLRAVDIDDDEDWPHGERCGDRDGVDALEYDEPGERDDPDAPGLGVLGVGEAAEPNEPG